MINPAEPRALNSEAPTLVGRRLVAVDLLVRAGGDDAVQPHAVAGLVVERAAGLVVRVEDDGSGDLAVVEVPRHGAGRLVGEGEV
jgi:hypothetical protein